MKTYRMPSMAELVEEMYRLSSKVDEALGELYSANQEYAVKDNEYRMAKARSLLRISAERKTEVPKPTVDILNALAELEVEEHRLDAKIAEGLKEAAIEAVRGARAQLSALQTVANALRQEMEFSRTTGD